jgi:DNA-binding NtrC family response regulator
MGALAYGTPVLTHAPGTTPIPTAIPTPISSQVLSGCYSPASPLDRILPAWQISAIDAERAVMSDIVLMSSGFVPPALEAVRRTWRVIDIEIQREALSYLRSMAELPAAICIGRALDIGDDLDAWQMLAAVQAEAPGVPVVISTREASPKVIVDLVKHGAFDYVLEPRSKDDPEDVGRYVEDLVFALSRAVRWRQVVEENTQLKQDLAQQNPPTALLSRSRRMGQVLELVRKVAPTEATVLITGESGTGKELAARSIHDLSGHRDGPFVALNCGAFSETLIASELFGHVKGAFTGADADRPGLIREAAGGTLFLDEISAIPPGFQVMLLRVLEQRAGRPVGGTGTYEVNCRFIAAANRDLQQLVAAGTFRADLFYRLDVFAVHLPPLRERREDIPLLADHFIREANRIYGKAVRALTPTALALLESATWPGNVRELRNAIERAVIIADADTLDVDLFDPQLRAGPPRISASAARLDYTTAMRDFERRLLGGTLHDCDGNRSAAARRLNLKRTRLTYRLRHLGLE